MHDMPRHLTLTLTTAVLMLGAAPTALAAPPLRYASPSGNSTNDCATPATACDIQTAISGNGANQPEAGQEVVVAPGTYNLTATLNPPVNLYVHGVFGQPRPVIIANGFRGLHPMTAFNNHFAYLEFDIHVVGDDDINILGGTLEQLLIIGDGDGGNVCQCYGGVLRDSVIVNTGVFTGAWGINSNGGTATETLRNDTFIATQATGYAMDLAQGGAANTLTADAKNVIAINTAGGHDVNAFGTTATITLADSDYASPIQASGGAVVDGGGNISAAPVFVNAAANDFREHATSPTIDHGTDDTATDGGLDLAGGPRLAGAHTDIGAFEYQPPNAAAAAGASPNSATVTQLFSSPLQAKVTDAQGNPAYDVTVTFTAPSTGATGTFGKGESTAQAVTGLDGVATAPAFTANTHAGDYVVTATATGVQSAAQLAVRNLAGPAAKLTLSPATQSTPAGRVVRYSLAAADSFGNPTSAAGAGLSIAPNGSCHGLACSALKPGAHTVTATLGSLHATAQLGVTPSAPKLKLKLGRRHSVGIDSRTHRARIAATCAAPAGEICAVTGKLTRRLHHHTVTLGKIKARLRAGRSGTLTITLSKAAAADLAQHGSRSATAAMRVVDLSGRGSAVVTLTLKSSG
jgi:hypothetical protein